MDTKKLLLELSVAAKAASLKGNSLSTERKNRALKEIAAGLSAGKKHLLKENAIDLSAGRKKGLKPAMLDRLKLDEKRIEGMAQSVNQIAALPDPVGEVIKGWRRPNGLLIHKVRVPIGVIAIIYESRPDVTSDCAALCLKSGNSVILRGGSESCHSNRAIVSIIREALKKAGIPEAMVTFIETTDRKAVELLVKMNRHIDLVIPRGGESLINTVVSSSLVPVIKHYKGICHVYVDEWADLNMASSICYNAKVQRPGVCNAMETMLVHRETAIRFLPGMLKKLQDAGVEVRGCAFTQKIGRNVLRATEADYRTEYLDLKLSVKVVESIEEAIDHINEYGSHHSDAIVTDDYDNAFRFNRQVDSACVYVNASTRFTDGNQFGLGAEMGISTDRLHARGPMGLEELTTYKYMVFGNGQVRT